MQVTFRQVLERDVCDLREIAIRTFRQSYEHRNTPSNFSWYIQRAFTIEKLLCEIQNKESCIYFTMLEKSIIGYLKLNVGDSQTEDFGEQYLEIERIYLDTSYKRKGFGRKMVEFSLQKAIEGKKSCIWLGVWDQNPEAIIFYRNMGFSKRGSHIFKFGNEDQVDTIMELIIKS